MESIPAVPQNIFQKLTYVVFLAGSFLLPLVFTPYLTNAFELPKWAVLVTMALLGLAFWALMGLTQKKLSLRITPLTKALGALTLVFVLSTVVNSPNRIASLWDKTGFILAGFVFFVVATSVLAQKAKQLFWGLVVSSFVLSWVAIFAYLNLLPKLLPFLANAGVDKRFTPAGGPLALISFLVVLMPATVFLALKKKDSLIKLLLFVVAAVQAVALVLTISLVLPNQANALALLPYSAGWSIAVDQFKTVRSALLGVGPADFVSAFTRFRPVTLNLGNLWSLRFGSSSNEIFNVLTTAGILGLAALAWVCLNLIRILNLKTARPMNLALGLGAMIVIILFLIIPANTVLLFTLFCLLAALSEEGKEININLRPLVVAISAITLIVTVALGYFTGQVWAAEQYFTQSLQAAAKNDGTATYNLQIKAINNNPFEIAYRVAYSNTNMALANSLANKKDLTDDDKNTITQLVSQAIREGKNSAALDPNNPAVWENLAAIYRQLINFAQGADQWALTAYVQAVRLDPTNPGLRVDLGGFLFATQNYDAAIDQFKRAADLKPDYANAYYNLAYVYQQKKDNVQAFYALQTASTLVDKNSADFDKVSQELEQLRKLLPPELQNATASAQQKASQLNTPQPLPSPRPAGQLPLNPQEQERLAPEVPSPAPANQEEEVLPTPSASPVASPAANP